MDHARVVLEVPPEASSARSLVDHARRRGFTSFLTSGAGGRSALSGTGVHGKRGDRIRLAGGRGSGSVRVVRGPADLPGVVHALRQFPVVLVEFRGDRVIPLENLLALRQGEAGAGTGELWVKASSAVQVPGLLGALEQGSDLVVLAVRTPEDVDQLETLLDRPRLTLAWRTANVARVSPGGIGERVAVDTTSLLGPHEGMLVGSQGAFLLHVVSEATGSRYTRPRPFRVNAGAVHSYTLLADGTTRYLSELEPGDRVVVAAPRGPPRSVRVGRLKIERRPLTLVEVEAAGQRRTLFAQEAETVRLSGPTGPRPVPDLERGDRILGVALPAARHFGMAVEETLIER